MQNVNDCNCRDKHMVVSDIDMILRVGRVAAGRVGCALNFFKLLPIATECLIRACQEMYEVIRNDIIGRNRHDQSEPSKKN